jgi:hypothetical protein
MVAASATMQNREPPSALAGLTCTPVDGLDWEFDGHDESIDAIYAIACPCGGRLFTVSAWFKDDEPRPPISIDCSACQAEHVVFDVGKHGYEAADRTFEVEPEGDIPDDLVPADFDPPHEVLVRYEYPDEEIRDPRWRGRAHELFSWFTILARDAKTGQLAFIFDEECA